MAYISKEEVKSIRENIKKEFPRKDGWKVSVTRQHYSTVVISFMESKINLDPEQKGNYSVNPYWIERHYEDQPKLKEVFTKALDCVSKDKVQVDRNAGDPGADYGDCNFFKEINVGKWDKHYVQV